MNGPYPHRCGNQSLAVALVAAVLTCSVGIVLAQDAPTPDRVQEVGEELAKSGTYPWYDSAKDALKAVTAVPESKSQSRNWNWNWSFPIGLWDIIRWLTWSMFGLLLAWIIYKLCQAYLYRETSRAAWVTNDSELPENAIEIDALPLPANESWGDLLDRARQLFEQGKYREAMIFLFSHQLLELNRQQIIHLAKGKTNRQYLREVRRQPTLAPLFEQSIETFELAFFGNQTLSREQFESVWRLQGAFQQQLASAGASS